MTTIDSTFKAVCSTPEFVAELKCAKATLIILEKIVTLGQFTSFGAVRQAKESTRYRKPTGSEWYFVQQLQEINSDLCVHADAIIKSAIESKNSEMHRLVQEFNQNKEDHAKASEALRGRLLIFGFECSPSVQAIAEYRAKLVGKKVEVQKKFEEAKDKADTEAREKAKSLVPLRNLASDIKCAKGWMTCFNSEVGARVYMENVCSEINKGNRELKGVYNVFVWSPSKDMQQVVHASVNRCLDKDGWEYDFVNYYEPCSRQAAQVIFESIKGISAEFKPDANVKTDMVAFNV